MGGGPWWEELPRPVSLGWSIFQEEKEDGQTDVILLPVAAYQAVLNPSKVTGDAVDHHGGHTGQRVEESELPSKSRVKAPHPTEARWNSDSGYVVDTLMWLDNFLKRTRGDGHKLAY